MAVRQVGMTYIRFLEGVVLILKSK